MVYASLVLLLGAGLTQASPLGIDTSSSFPLGGGKPLANAAVQTCRTQFGKRPTSLSTSTRSLTVTRHPQVQVTSTATKVLSVPGSQTTVDGTVTKTVATSVHADTFTLTSTLTSSVLSTATLTDVANIVSTVTLTGDAVTSTIVAPSGFKFPNVPSKVEKLELRKKDSGLIARAGSLLDLVGNLFPVQTSSPSSSLGALQYFQQLPATVTSLIPLLLLSRPDFLSKLQALLPNPSSLGSPSSDTVTKVLNLVGTYLTGGALGGGIPSSIAALIPSALLGNTDFLTKLAPLLSGLTGSSVVPTTTLNSIRSLVTSFGVLPGAGLPSNLASTIPLGLLTSPDFIKVLPSALAGLGSGSTAPNSVITAVQNAIAPFASPGLPSAIAAIIPLQLLKNPNFISQLPTLLSGVTGSTVPASVITNIQNAVSKFGISPNGGIPASIAKLIPLALLQSPAFLTQLASILPVSVSAGGTVSAEVTAAVSTAVLQNLLSPTGAVPSGVQSAVPAATSVPASVLNLLGGLPSVLSPLVLSILAPLLGNTIAPALLTLLQGLPAANLAELPTSLLTRPDLLQLIPTGVFKSLPILQAIPTDLFGNAAFLKDLAALIPKDFTGATLPTGLLPNVQKLISQYTSGANPGLPTGGITPDILTNLPSTITNALGPNLLTLLKGLPVANLQALPTALLSNPTALAAIPTLVLNSLPLLLSIPTYLLSNTDFLKSLAAILPTGVISGTLPSGLLTTVQNLVSQFTKGGIPGLPTGFLSLDILKNLPASISNLIPANLLSTLQALPADSLAKLPTSILGNIALLQLIPLSVLNSPDLLKAIPTDLFKNADFLTALGKLVPTGLTSGSVLPTGLLTAVQALVAQFNPTGGITPDILNSLSAGAIPDVLKNALAKLPIPTLTTIPATLLKSPAAIAAIPQYLMGNTDFLKTLGGLNPASDLPAQIQALVTKFGAGGLTPDILNNLPVGTIPDTLKNSLLSLPLDTLAKIPISSLGNPTALAGIPPVLFGNPDFVKTLTTTFPNLSSGSPVPTEALNNLITKFPVALPAGALTSLPSTLSPDVLKTLSPSVIASIPPAALAILKGLPAGIPTGILGNLPALLALAALPTSVLNNPTLLQAIIPSLFNNADFLKALTAAIPAGGLPTGPVPAAIQDLIKKFSSSSGSPTTGNGGSTSPSSSSSVTLPAVSGLPTGGITLPALAQALAGFPALLKTLQGVPADNLKFLPATLLQDPTTLSKIPLAVLNNSAALQQIPTKLFSNPDFLAELTKITSGLPAGTTLPTPFLTSIQDLVKKFNLSSLPGVTAPTGLLSGLPTFLTPDILKNLPTSFIPTLPAGLLSKLQSLPAANLGLLPTSLLNNPSLLQLLPGNLLGSLSLLQIIPPGLFSNADFLKALAAAVPSTLAPGSTIPDSVVTAVKNAITNAGGVPLTGGLLSGNLPTGPLTLDILNNLPSKILSGLPTGYLDALKALSPSTLALIPASILGSPDLLKLIPISLLGNTDFLRILSSIIPSGLTPGQAIPDSVTTAVKNAVAQATSGSPAGIPNLPTTGGLTPAILSGLPTGALPTTILNGLKGLPTDTLKAIPANLLNNGNFIALLGPILSAGGSPADVLSKVQALVAGFNGVPAGALPNLPLTTGILNVLPLVASLPPTIVSLLRGIPATLLASIPTNALGNNNFLALLPTIIPSTLTPGSIVPGTVTQNLQSLVSGLIGNIPTVPGLPTGPLTPTNIANLPPLLTGSLPAGLLKTLTNLPPALLGLISGRLLGSNAFTSLLSSILPTNLTPTSAIPTDLAQKLSSLTSLFNGFSNLPTTGLTPAILNGLSPNAVSALPAPLLASLKNSPTNFLSSIPAFLLGSPNFIAVLSRIFPNIASGATVPDNVAQIVPKLVSGATTLPSTNGLPTTGLTLAALNALSPTVKGAFPAGLFDYLKSLPATNLALIPASLLSNTGFTTALGQIVGSLPVGKALDADTVTAVQALVNLFTIGSVGLNLSLSAGASASKRAVVPGSFPTQVVCDAVSEVAKTTTITKTTEAIVTSTGPATTITNFATVTSTLTKPIDAKVIKTILETITKTLTTTKVTKTTAVSTATAIVQPVEVFYQMCQDAGDSFAFLKDVNAKSEETLDAANAYECCVACLTTEKCGASEFSAAEGGFNCKLSLLD